MNKGIKIKQGVLVPPTVTGFGYLMVGIYIFFVVKNGVESIVEIPQINFFLVLFALIQFSVKDFIVNKENPEEFITRYRILGFIPISKKNPFKSFSNYVIRVVKKQYLVNRTGMNMGRVDDEYWAIVARNRKTKEIEEICKGKKSDLDKVIAECIHPIGITIYRGAAKKGYEYQIKK